MSEPDRTQRPSGGSPGGMGHAPGEPQRVGRHAGRRGPQGLGRAYQGAFEAVMAIVVAGALGAFADSRLGTSPWLLMAGVVLGFGAFVLRLVRMLEWMNASASGRAEAPAPPDPDPGSGRRGRRESEE